MKGEPAMTHLDERGERMDAIRARRPPLLPPTISGCIHCVSGPAGSGGNAGKAGWQLVHYDDSLNHKPPFGYYDALPGSTSR